MTYSREAGIQVWREGVGTELPNRPLTCNMVVTLASQSIKLVLVLLNGPRGMGKWGTRGSSGDGICFVPPT